MLKRIKLLSFDITKTLITTSNSIGVEYLKIAKNYGLKVNDDNMEEKLNKSFEKNFKIMNQKFPNFGLNANMTSAAWWSNLIQLMFAEFGFTADSDRKIIEQISGHLYLQYSRGNCWHLNPFAQELLSDLRNQKPTITLAIASNFDERLETILRDLGIRHFFNFMFVSRQCRLAKPDTNFFRHILKTVEIQPDEYLHVGDDVENDYFPVKKINAKALIIDPTLAALKLPNIDSNDVIPDLKSLKKLIIPENTNLKTNLK